MSVLFEGPSGIGNDVLSQFTAVLVIVCEVGQIEAIENVLGNVEKG